MFALAPPIPDLFQSQKAFEADEEEMKRFYPDDPKGSEE